MLHVETAGSGPDLVLLHGWGLHSGAWTEVLPLLRESFRVHAIDLPGHGRSARIEPTTLDACAEAVVSMLPPRTMLCGWSLGGLVAQRIAAWSPERLRALALVSTTPCFLQRDDWAHAMKPATLDAFAKGLATNTAATLRDFVRLNALHGAHGREAIRAFTERLTQYGTPSPVALQATLGWLAETDVRDEIADVSLPTVVIHGTRDALAPVEAGRWLAAELPNAALVEITDAAHLPFFTHARQFVDAVETLRG